MRLNIQLFAWKLVRNMIPTSDKHRNLGLSINEDCSFYSKMEESTDHIFKYCEFATKIWHTISDNCLKLVKTNLDIVH